MAEAAPKGFGLSLGVAVIAMFIGVAAFGFAYVGASSQVTSLQSEVSTLQSQIPSLVAKSGLASVNATPTIQAFRIAWCLGIATGTDGFCPPLIIVDQGDTVQILFESNDTDAHTFTIVSGQYDFQLNDTYGAAGSNGTYGATNSGMVNYLTNTAFQSSCINAPYSEESAGLSPSDCASGTSLLAPGGSFAIPINSCGGGLSFCDQASPVTVTVDNMFHLISENATYDASWTIGSFQASEAGIFEFYCYYHVSNGMFGYMIVLPNSYCNNHASACGITSTS